MTPPAGAPGAPFTRKKALALSAPMILANAAVPLAGVVDTAVISAHGTGTDLAGVALGVTLMNIVVACIYFLRMGSAGLTAQANGAGDDAESQRVLIRAMAIGLTLGVFALATGPFLTAGGLNVASATTEVEDAAGAYFLARLWGAPALFVALAQMGWMIGVGRTGGVMVATLVFSGVNIVLDLVFVAGLGWGVHGLGLATSIGEWAAAAVSTVIILRVIARSGGWRKAALDVATLFDRAALKRLFGVNLALMLRTWALVGSIAYFVNAAAVQGDAMLAGAHVLMQFITLAAFVLDAYAFTAETAVGRAIGLGSRSALRKAVRVTGELSVLSGLALSVLILVAGPVVIKGLVKDPAAANAALTFLPYCALVPFVGAPAWHLDGVFIGAVMSAVMRNATIAAALIYLALDAALTRGLMLGGHGLWLAYIGFYLARAGCLAVAYPALERKAAPTASPAEA